jgi:O-antigen/teichoic acid export membrane protein
LANTTIGIAAALIVIGVVGYVATDRQSATALIPAFLGLLLMAFGWLARGEAYRKHAMHAVAVFALLGLLGTIGGLIRLLGGTTTPAAISRGLTALLTGALLALCVRSFIDARRRRAQG